MAPPIINMWTPIVKRQRIARHNKAVHLITQTLQANKHIWFFTWTNAGKLTNQPLDQTVPKWILKCTCTQETCQCQAKSGSDIMCVIGAPNQTQTIILPSPNYTIQFIKFTYCHDKILEQARTRKHTKYDPLITTLQNNGWKTNTFITITVGV